MSDSDDEMDEQQNISLSPRQEVDKYLTLASTLINFNDVDRSLLVWWTQQTFNLPRLSKVAIRLLSVPASSSGVEQLLSTFASDILLVHYNMNINP